MHRSLVLLMCLAWTCLGKRVESFRKDSLLTRMDAHASVGNVPLKSLAALLAASTSGTAFQTPVAVRTAARTPRGVAASMEAIEPQSLKDLKILAQQLNPAVGFIDPLKLTEITFSGQTDWAVGFLRHAEIKHGRVAMAAFVGYLVQSNGISFPWQLTLDGISFRDIAAAGSPPEQWDALPSAAKLQILIFIGFLETWSETKTVLEKEGGAHYMNGGVPGKFPKFNGAPMIPHGVPLELYDPFNLNSKKSRQTLDKGLLAEINNGRLAMLGIMAFLAEQKVPGAVPMLKGLVPPYSGEVMAPFAAGDVGLPLVRDMLENNPLAVEALMAKGMR